MVKKQKGTSIILTSCKIIFFTVALGGLFLLSGGKINGISAEQDVAVSMLRQTDPQRYTDIFFSLGPAYLPVGGCDILFAINQTTLTFFPQ